MTCLLREQGKKVNCVCSKTDPRESFTFLCFNRPLSLFATPSLTFCKNYELFKPAPRNVFHARDQTGQAWHSMPTRVANQNPGFTPYCPRGHCTQLGLYSWKLLQLKCVTSWPFKCVYLRQKIIHKSWGLVLVLHSATCLLKTRQLYWQW